MHALTRIDSNYPPVGAPASSREPVACILRGGSSTACMVTETGRLYVDRVTATAVTTPLVSDAFTDKYGVLALPGPFSQVDISHYGAIVVLAGGRTYYWRYAWAPCMMPVPIHCDDRIDSVSCLGREVVMQPATSRYFYHALLPRDDTDTGAIRARRVAVLVNT